MRSVYILLARTETIFSKAIHAATGDPYTHSSLALDRELTQMYSFARRWKRLPCFGGFIRERVDRGIYGENPHAPCALYELSVSEEAYARLSVCVGDLYAQRFRWRYNYLGAAANFWGKSRRGKRSRFCSEFVAQALLDAGAIPKCPESQPFLDPARVRPSMFAQFPGAKCVYKGNLRELSQCIAPQPADFFAHTCRPTPQLQR